MPPVLNRHMCPGCNRPFLTYLDDMQYCNSFCKAKNEYKEKFGSEKKKSGTLICGYCKKPFEHNGLIHRKYCNQVCYDALKALLRERKKPKKPRKPKEVHE